MATRSTLVSRISAITAEAEAKAAMVVAKTAADVEAGAKVRSRVDTGAMKSAWTTTPHGQFEAEVSNGVDYAVYNEYGTRHMSAQPMAVPAAEDARSGFEQALRSLYQ